MNTQSKIYKVALIGDGGVGKSTFAKSLITNGVFEKKYVPTIGTDVHRVTVDGVHFNLWDCAGQEKFGGLGDGYYVAADCAIIMCDDKLTYQHAVKKWLPSFKRVAGPNAPVEFVFNKSDLARGDDIVDFHQTSVKNNQNVSEVFSSLITKLSA